MVIVIALVIGVGGTRLVDWQWTQYRRAHRTLSGNVARPFRVSNSHFRFVDPLLGYELPARGNVEPFRSIRSVIASAVADVTHAREAAYISVYYRDLATGSWFGIDENRAYAPASLAKVPLMIAYLKLAEQDPDLLEQRVPFVRARGSVPEQHIAPTVRLVLGRTYTINELIRAMIVHSDNDAAFLLQAAADPHALSAVYADLNIDPPDFHNPNDTMTPEAFARFFRFLYNGTYLTRELSERALELLTESTFERGLAAGIPAGIPIAHKFGERVFASGDTGASTAELHDCGIVYHPQHPFLLCVMSRGWDLDILASAIARVTAAAYTEVHRMRDTNDPPKAS